MKICANAKINLYLSVLDKRPDGYHNIESVMHSVSLYDTVTLDAADARETSISLTITDPALPTDEKNIAFRAAKLFMHSLPGERRADIRIHIEKNIPVAGGLAGGSTDGAAVLRGLNKLFDEPFNKDELCRLGARIGADVPFCILGGAAVTLGIGDIMTPVPSLPECTILIVRPHESVSTADAYRLIDALPHDSRTCPQLASIVDPLHNGSLHGVVCGMYNIFESVIPEHSEVFGIKRLLTRCGALSSMMSGSGPSVFGIFDDSSAVASAMAELKKNGYGSFPVSPSTKFFT